jgi:hypothetical protein
VENPPVVDHFPNGKPWVFHGFPHLCVNPRIIARHIFLPGVFLSEHENNDRLEALLTSPVLWISTIFRIAPTHQKVDHFYRLLTTSSILCDEAMNMNMGKHDENGDENGPFGIISSKGGPFSLDKGFKDVLPVGNLTVRYLKWSFMVDLPSKKGEFQQQTVNVYQRVRCLIYAKIIRREGTWARSAKTTPACSTLSTRHGKHYRLQICALEM